MWILRDTLHIVLSQEYRKDVHLWLICAQTDYTTALWGLNLMHSICTQVSMWGGDTLTIHVHPPCYRWTCGGAKYGQVADEIDMS